MITARLIRDAMSPTEPTLGRLYADDLALYTIEDAWLGNAHDTSCIPVGTYRLVISMSNRFKKLMPEVLAVPNRTGIRVHGGITAASVTGCVGVGTQRSDDGVLLHGFRASADFREWLTEALTHDKVQLAITVGGPDE